MWDFSHVEPTFKKYVQDKGIEYDPAHPLDGLDEIGAGEMLKRAFTYMKPVGEPENSPKNPRLEQAKNLATFSGRDQSTASRWYQGKFSEDALFNGIFPVLCDAYVKAFCEPGYEDCSGFADEYQSRGYTLKRECIELVPLADGVSLYEGHTFLHTFEIELRALAILLTGEQDPHIYRNPVGWESIDNRRSRERYKRAVVRLAASALQGYELSRLADIAEDYLRLRVYEMEDWERGRTDKATDQQVLERFGIASHVKEHRHTTDAATYDEWAENFERVAAMLATEADLRRQRDGSATEIERRVEKYMQEGEKWDMG